MNAFYDGPPDLSRAHAAIDTADAHRLSDDGLASWAHGVVDEPETERDLGQLADWACEVTERRETPTPSRNRRRSVDDRKGRSQPRRELS